MVIKVDPQMKIKKKLLMKLIQLLPEIHQTSQTKLYYQKKLMICKTDLMGTFMTIYIKRIESKFRINSI